MEKILLVIDCEQPNVPAIDFACYVANLTRSKLTGIFIGDMQKEEPVSSDTCNLPNRSAATDLLSSRYSWRQVIDDTVRLFELLCSNKSVRNEIMYLDLKQAARQVISESRFADLLIVKAETSLGKKLEGVPSHFVTEVLAAAECPVLLAPPSFEDIDEIIFAYDGSKSSVFAIRQFTYLFPCMEDKRVMILEVIEQSDEGLTEKEKIKELLKAHYSGIGYHVLHGKVVSELLTYLLNKKTSMVVMGAYGRSIFSRSAKPSTANKLLKAVNCPFFITHH